MRIPEFRHSNLRENVQARYRKETSEQANLSESSFRFYHLPSRVFPTADFFYPFVNIKEKHLPGLSAFVGAVFAYNRFEVTNGF